MLPCTLGDISLISNIFYSNATYSGLGFLAIPYWFSDTDECLEVKSNNKVRGHPIH